MQRKEVWTASKMHLLLIRNTAVEREENAWPETRKGTCMCTILHLRVYTCVRVCVYTYREKIWVVYKP